MMCVYWCICHSVRYYILRWCVCIGVSVTLYANVAGDDVCVLVYLSLSCLLQLVACIRVTVTVKGTLKTSLNTVTPISLMRRADQLSRGILPIVVSLSLIEEPHKEAYFH